MAQAPDGNDTLTPDHAAKILEELLDAQNHAKLLCLMLNVKPRDVEAIIKNFKDPKEQLFHIILAFLQQAELRPTWRAIVDALRSPVVGLTALAIKIESHHFPDSTTSRETVPETAGVLHCENEVKSKQSTSHLTPTTTTATTSRNELCLSYTSKDITKRINEMKMLFDRLKKTIRDCLEKSKFFVKDVADALTSASADEDEQHKLFMDSHVSVLFRAADVPELFGTMNLHWNYLHPYLLEHLVQSFKLEEVKGELEYYKSELKWFIKETPLALFCSTQKKRRPRLSPDFREMVAEFDWPEHATLTQEIVEQFQQEYASQYNLRDCAMMVSQIRPGSFIITWFIPESIVEVLTGKPARAVLKKFLVTRLDIDGVCIYRQRKLYEKQNIPVATTPTVERVSSITKPKVAPSQAKPLSEEEYLYVDQPAEDFFCPVMMGLLLQPHLTSCCGNHLSHEAVERIEGGRGVCPLCKEKHWSTMLDKRFQRQVNSLQVFCCHEERGCGWQGEVASYKSHVKSCPFARGPLMTELAKLPVYSEDRASAVMKTTIPKPKTSSFPTQQLAVQCRIKVRAPIAMIPGSATSDERFAYFTSFNSNDIYQFEYINEEWKRLPSCPYYNSGLAIINGELTTVGGSDYNTANKLMTLQGSQWVKKYSPMKIGRSHPAIVTTEDGTYHIVIGGFVCGIGLSDWSDEIEIFNGRRRKWFKARKLPSPLEYPLATISENQLYVTGYGTEYVGYSFSLQVFTFEGKPTTSSLIILPWNPLPPLSMKGSTPATLCGQLVLVGGRDAAKNVVNSIYQLMGLKWVNIGSMKRARSDCFVFNLSSDKIIIVGGVGGSDIVEECTSYYVTPV